MITLLERHQLGKIFKYVLIDNMTPDQISNLECQVIPALVVIKVDGQQQFQNMFEGTKAFEWVENFLIGRRQAMMSRAENSRKLIQSNNTKQKLTEQLFEYCPSEHSGMSDIYSTVGNDVAAQQKTFAGIEYENDNLGAIPLSCKGKDYKNKEGLTAIYGNELKTVINRFSDDRRKQDEQLKQNMEKDTLRIVADRQK